MRRKGSRSTVFNAVALVFVLFVIFWQIKDTTLIIDLPQKEIKADDPAYDPIWTLKAQYKFTNDELYRVRQRHYLMMADIHAVVLAARHDQVSVAEIAKVLKQYDTTPGKVYSKTLETASAANFKEQKWKPRY